MPLSLLATTVLVASLSRSEAAPRISEFVAQNRYSLADENGDSEDWIEIENTEATEISLAGWYLTDNPENLTKWTFPAVTLPPNGYVIVFASNKDRVDPAGKLHTNFTLQTEGEFVALVEPDGTTIASSYTPPAQFKDISYGVGTVGASIVSVPVDKGTNAKYFVAATD
ncbi:MAG: lamin tail domain-containing protein, partial [Verrucomicrobia bacterium]|nr:lamin tail domain-containing protein [Verrucomicrobiota bacterium]